MPHQVQCEIRNEDSPRTRALFFGLYVAVSPKRCKDQGCYWSLIGGRVSAIDYWKQWPWMTMNGHDALYCIHFFPNGWEFSVQILQAYYTFPYAILHIFIQLPAITLTKLRHIKRHHPVHIIYSKCPRTLGGYAMASCPSVRLSVCLCRCKVLALWEFQYNAGGIFVAWTIHTISGWFALARVTIINVRVSK